MVSGKAFSTCLRALLAMCVFALLVEVSARPYPEKFSRTLSDCQTDAVISSVCYYCASLYQSEFDAVHAECCKGGEQVRTHCLAWYTEDPKRGSW